MRSRPLDAHRRHIAAVSAAPWSSPTDRVYRLRVCSLDDRVSRPLNEGPEPLRRASLTQLLQRLGLDLTDALAGDAEALPDVLERVLGTLADAEAHAQDGPLARRQRAEQPLGLVGETARDRGVDRRERNRVLDEVGEFRVLLGA